MEIFDILFSITVALLNVMNDTARLAMMESDPALARDLVEHGCKVYEDASVSCR